MKYHTLLTTALCFILTLCVSTQLLATDLIIFSATWCKNCDYLKLFLDQNKDILKDYNIEILDIDENPELKKTLDIRSVPTSIIFNEDGTIKSKKVGYDKSYKQWLQGK